MTDQNNQEPTMEEILASIRRIISEDDAPGEDGAPVAEAAPPPPAPEPEPAPPPAYEPPEVSAQIEEDVLELTDRVDAGAAAAPVESVGDLDVFSSEPPTPEPAPPPPVAAAPQPPAYAPPAQEEETLLSAPAAATAAGAFAALSSSIGMPRDGRTLEDVTRELLRPLLKQWLDDNLPRIVETAVQNEVERISRQRGV